MDFKVPKFESLFHCDPWRKSEKPPARLRPKLEINIPSNCPLEHEYRNLLNGPAPRHSPTYPSRSPISSFSSYESPLGRSIEALFEQDPSPSWRLEAKDSTSWFKEPYAERGQRLRGPPGFKATSVGNFKQPNGKISDGRLSPLSEQKLLILVKVPDHELRPDTPLSSCSSSGSTCYITFTPIPEASKS